MHAAFDLTERQTARVLEQALRTRAAVEIEPSGADENRRLTGALAGQEGGVLTVRTEQRPAGILQSGLIGAFCDIRLVLSDQLYLFSSCILDVSEADAPAHLLLSAPDQIRVANRRRFERRTVPVAAQVRIKLASGAAPVIGLVADVSGDGLACTMPVPSGQDPLLVGDEVRLSFELPGVDEGFDLPAVICNKSETPDKQLLTLGLEFCPAAEGSPEALALVRLQNVLYELTAESTGMDGDA